MYSVFDIRYSVFGVLCSEYRIFVFGILYSVVCIMYSVFCILYMYYVHVYVYVKKKHPNKTISTTRVLGARGGGRQSSNPAKETTHSWRGEKKTHYMNVVGIK